MSKTIETSQSGIGFCGLLAIVFIAFKLGGVIAWPWVWVLAPIWIPYALALFVVAIVLIVGALG